MIKKISTIFLSIVFTCFLLAGFSALAADEAPAAAATPNPLSVSNPQTKAFLLSSGVSVTNVAGIVGTIITAALSLLGIIFVVLLIYAGFQWMTAEGNEEKIEKSKHTITRAIIGLAIIIAAYSITYFIFNALSGTGGGGTHMPYPP
ncbi:MAG: hypothetical protein PHO56_03030 [Patescibacteria group bacterium]|nr:hypothetical protein [Patescibacteria group bacterium]